MRPDKHKLAQEWIYGEATPMEEAKATWESMDAEFNANRKIQLAEKDNFNTPDLEQSPDSFLRPGETLEDFDVTFRRPNAEGGMQQLVQPNADGSRPGYSGKNKFITPQSTYVTPQKRSGAESFKGQKFYDIKDPTYSDGRRRVKTKEYAAWLKKEQEKGKKRKDFGKSNFLRREEPLLRIAEAMQQADINDDLEHLMLSKDATKQVQKTSPKPLRIYNKGMLNAGDIVFINNLEKNFDDVIFIADQLGESTDWVLDKLDERTEFRDFSRAERTLEKENPKYKKPRNDYLKVENWLQKNAKRYSNPETFEKALIKRFGKNNQFVKDMLSFKPSPKSKSTSGFVTTYFSDEFKKTMLNMSPESRANINHLKQLIKSSLYNFNPKIKKAITEEIKGIFNSENLPKLRTEARTMLNNNKLLSQFGLNKAITGPFAKVIQAEIGQQMWDDITGFRQHRLGTYEMLKAFEQLVPTEFKPIFNESAKSILYSQTNQWNKAKEVFGIADNIAWDHKVPSSIIDKGYADIIEYTKVNPTTSNFNERIKNLGFDRKINKELEKFEKAKTFDEKVKIKNNMETIKNNFSKKYKGYLDEVSINLDKKGNLKFSSSANPLTKTDDRVAMLGKSLVQEGFFDQKKINKLLKDFEARGCGKAAGGRILFSNGGEAITTCAKKGVAGFIDDLKKGNYSKATVNILKGGGNVLKNILDPKELLKLRNYFGPVALGFMAAYEGGVIGDDVIRQGTPLNESLANNWLTKSFLPYTQDYAEAKNLLETGNVPSNMKKYVEDVVTFNESLKDMQGIQNRVSSRIADVGGYGMLDGSSMYSKKQEDKDVNDLIKKMNTISEDVVTPGTAKALEMKSLQDEMKATRMAKKEFSPIFGFGNLEDRNQKTDFDSYISPVDTSKDLRPVTYQDAEYTDVRMPVELEQAYMNKFGLKPRDSLSNYKFKDSDISILQELTDNYNKFQRQKEASQYPGYYGTQEPDRFMEGGIASLNVNKK
tara:strand:- start:13 stop:2991 length:2979 start_codon:yes stop_codon:yes gene_type:complete